MSEFESIGMIVMGLSAIVVLFQAVYKPLNNNTKAITTLTVKLDYMIQRMDDQEEKHNKHIEDFEKYKEKVRESQKRQWDEIDRQKKEITELKNK